MFFSKFENDCNFKEYFGGKGEREGEKFWVNIAVELKPTAT